MEDWYAIPNTDFQTVEGLLKEHMTNGTKFVPVDCTKDRDLEAVQKLNELLTSLRKIAFDMEQKVFSFEHRIEWLESENERLTKLTEELSCEIHTAKNNILRERNMLIRKKMPFHFIPESVTLD